MVTTPRPTDTLLEIHGLEKHFPVNKGLVLKHTYAHVKAVDGVDLRIREGKTFSLVGESGCGKTTLAKLILRIETPSKGEILFRGEDVHAMKGQALHEYRRFVQVIFQDPFSSLNPRMRIQDIIGEPLVNLGRPKEEIHKRVLELLDLMGINRTAVALYPHQFSGGQRQRVAIARALASNPRFLVLDEPVSALDVSIRAQIMNLLKDLQAKFNLTYLMISHDLPAVRYMSDVVGVMYLGKIVEIGSASDVCDKPLHPYTRALISNAIITRPGETREEVLIEGEPPSPMNVPAGCRFHPRCPFVMPECSKSQPPLEEIEPGHFAACFLHKPGKIGQAKRTT